MTKSSIPNDQATEQRKTKKINKPQINKQTAKYRSSRQAGFISPQCLTLEKLIITPLHCFRWQGELGTKTQLAVLK